MKVKVVVTLKDGVLDPQGQAIQRSLGKMGYQDVTEVRQGKYFELEFNGDDRTEVLRLVEEIAAGVLSNPLIEQFEVEEVECDLV
ncbi:MAG: phosphoribosylformylglycinamidine synthase subunit PurS [Acidobacteriota bacterium]